MSKILVTGGLGYIGSHTVAELVNKDYEVIYVDHESTKVLVCLNNVIYPLDWVNENFMIKK